MIKQTRSTKEISLSERREIIEEYLKGDRTKREIWREYTGQNGEHGILNRWMRQLGYLEKTFPVKRLPLLGMSDSKKPDQSVEDLQKKIKLLEQQLLDSQLKEEAYRRMIDIAEKELKVSIRKKSNTK